MAELQYPIGQEEDMPVTEDNLKEWIENLVELPQKLKEAVAGLSDEQLNTPYRPDGWSVKQVVHHVADSHMNSYIRCRLALTERNPTITPYEETLWAEMIDASLMPVAPSLQILEGLHARWTSLLHSLSLEDYQRTFYHPGTQKTLTIGECVRLYSWHSLHHTAHITSLRGRMNW
ncbi:putative metal-dependent hydrolase [Paenibacillus polygoni]|uniref:Putative metal-dependent hydrolase QPK24_06955 n=1 Tax=Paenibacillus polygoni TaxID=3050112 RepID=A0ABY8X7A0_9BACL|nr:putative metal-dependent hydrolase [Paenibacillus polygoni]WIV21426.1 putative metal-dependent hydrolase [Paenibacillus polygoni]